MSKRRRITKYSNLNIDNIIENTLDTQILPGETPQTYEELLGIKYEDFNVDM